QAGDLVTVQVLSVALRGRISNPIDSVLRVYDAAGNLVPYYLGTPAENDDNFENQDALLLDLQLPTTGTYYIEVSTYTNTDIGDYELFVYSFATTTTGRLGGGGDTLVGGPGNDVLIGSTGDDRFVGSLSEDIFIGKGPDDIAA